MGTIAKVEREEADQIILYHALSPMHYFHAWILHCVNSGRPLQWMDGGFDDANLAAISLRVFGEHDLFPAFTNSSYRTNNEFVKALTEQKLKNSGVENVTNFLSHLMQHEIFNAGMPDHQAGVRD